MSLQEFAQARKAVIEEHRSRVFDAVRKDAVYIELTQKFKDWVTQINLPTDDELFQLIPYSELRKTALGSNLSDVSNFNPSFLIPYPNYKNLLESARKDAGEFLFVYRYSRNITLVPVFDAEQSLKSVYVVPTWSYETPPMPQVNYYISPMSLRSSNWAIDLLKEIEDAANFVTEVCNAVFVKSVKEIDVVSSLHDANERLATGWTLRNVLAADNQPIRYVFIRTVQRWLGGQ